MSSLRFETFTGQTIQPYIPELAKLRMTLFREYPYLYEGDSQYETNYLNTYMASPDSFVVVVFDGDKVVGAATGIPLSHETEAFKRPFIEQGYDLNQIMYFGEGLLYPEYQGQAIGLKLGLECEKKARQHGAKITTFCAVERPDNHPYKPAHYTPFDVAWHKYGYEKKLELRTTYAWKDIGDVVETHKPMVFWLKHQN